MLVEVYRNLHKDCFSIRCTKTKKVLGHASAVHLRKVSFKVSEAGRQRVLREKRKNVHAVVRGYLNYADDFESYKGREVQEQKFKGLVYTRYFKVSYNPYTAPTFHLKETGTPIHECGYITISKNMMVGYGT